MHQCANTIPDLWPTTHFISTYHIYLFCLFRLQPSTGVAAVAAVAAADVVGVGATAPEASGSPGRAAGVVWIAVAGAGAAGISAGS